MPRGCCKNQKCGFCCSNARALTIVLMFIPKESIKTMNYSNMKTIKGPAIFIAQFIGDEAPFNSLESICTWAKNLGYKGVQLPTLDDRFIDLKKAAESKTYADDLKGRVNA